MEEGIVIGGVVILGGLALASGMVDNVIGMPGASGGSGGYISQVPLGLAPSKKEGTGATEPVMIKLPEEHVEFPAPAPVTFNLGGMPTPRYIGGGGGGSKKYVHETSLMKSIRTTGKVPTISLPSPSYPSAPAPSDVVGSKKVATTTRLTAPSAPAGTHVRTTYAAPTPRSFQSPYISAPTPTPTAKKTTHRPSRSIWSRLSSVFSGIFGRR